VKAAGSSGIAELAAMARGAFEKRPGDDGDVDKELCRLGDALWTALDGETIGSAKAVLAGQVRATLARRCNLRLRRDSMTSAGRNRPFRALLTTNKPTASVLALLTR